MHKTSGLFSSIHCCTRGSLAFNELTFHVAISTATNYYATLIFSWRELYVLALKRGEFVLKQVAFALKQVAFLTS
jgi:hypothetical protein